MSERTVVISQPMYFPWVGMFEQLALADVFVFLDHVQFARGFINRVQYKTAQECRWLTVPLRKHSRDTAINELHTVDDEWKRSHLTLLAAHFKGYPHAATSLGLMEQVFAAPQSKFSDLLIVSILAVRDYFELSPACEFHKSSELAPDERKSDLIKGLVQQFSGTRYVTGHGALNYLDHEGFEASGISVHYMNYQKLEYPQLHSPFTPFVTVLDLVASQGKDGRRCLAPRTRSWRDTLKAREIESHEST